MGKPFVKLLAVADNLLFYDVNKNDIVEIDEETYEYLTKVEQGELEFSPNHFEKISNLVLAGYLSDKRVKKIKHSLTDSVDMILDKNIQKITLQVTQNCNLRCEYCAYTENKVESHRNHSSKRMSLETAKEAILFLKEHSYTNKVINIGFYGGEPLLEFDLIKYCVDLSQRIFIDKTLKYTITTNATLLNREIMDFLVKNSFDIVISLDGIKEVNDRNRRFNASPNSVYDAVIDSLKMIVEHYPNYIKKITINSVIDASCDFELHDIMYSEPILKPFAKRMSFIDDYYSEKEAIFSDSFISKYEYQVFMLYMSIIGRISSECISSFVFSNEITKLTDFKKFTKTTMLEETSCPGGPCLAGHNRLLVTVDGEFFPCERVSETSEVMKIGNLQDGVDKEKVKKMLNVAVDTKEECINCWGFNQCMTCQKFSDGLTNFSKTKRLNSCKSSLLSIEKRLKEYFVLGKLYKKIVLEEYQ